MKLLANKPKITIFPELLNKINKYTNLCEHSIYWIGKVAMEDNEYRICDIVLPMQTVGKKAEIDVEDLIDIQSETLEQGYYTYCIGRTKKNKSVVISNDDIKLLKDIYGELETAIYIQTNTMGDISLNVFDFNRGIWFDELSLQVLDTEFFEDDEIKKELDESIIYPVKNIRKTTGKHETEGVIMVDNKVVSSVTPIETTVTKKEIKKVEYVPNDFVKADEPFTHLVSEVYGEYGVESIK